MSKTNTITITTSEASHAVRAIRTRLARLREIQRVHADIGGNGTAEEIRKAEEWITSLGYESSQQVREEISELSAASDRMRNLVLDLLC